MIRYPTCFILRNILWFDYKKNNIAWINTNDYLKSKLIGLNYINKSSPNLMNINYNNNQNNEYKETKFIDKEVDMNYYQDFNPLY